jgi:MFS family permease
MTRDLFLVLASLLLWGMGEGSFFFFQTLYLEQWGANALQIGAILSGWGLSMALTQIPAGYLADRRGPRLLMWATWILGTIAATVMAAANSLGVFVAGIMIYGLTSSALAPMNSYIAAVRGRWSPERALTTAAAVYNLGMMIGPSLGGWLAERYSLRMVYALAAVIFLFSTLLILNVRRPPRIDHSALPKSTPIFSNHRFLVLVGLTLLTMFALLLPQPLTPNFLADQRGLNLQQIGLLGTIGSFGTVVFSTVLGGLKGQLGFLIGQPLVALFALLIWQGNHMLAFSAGFFLLGGYRLSRVMVIGLARRMVHPRQVGLAFGLLETVNAGAIILSPLLAGALYQRAPGWVYIATLILIGVALLANVIFLYSKRIPAPALETAHQPNPE